jgi:type II secretory pathway component PulM
MWNRLSKREKFLLFGLLGTAVFFCFYYYIFNPQLKAYNQVKTELDEQRTKLFRAQNTAASLTTETAQLEKVKCHQRGRGAF